MCPSSTDERRSGRRVQPIGLIHCILLAVFTAGWTTPAAAGQFGALVSPGPLAKAHATVEGAGKCQSCHEVGRKVTAARCLACHKPIADRIGKSVGVHRNAKECVSCHVEHAGVDAELRHIDTRAFNHVVETGFALDGQHAKTAANCAACHKSHSYLEAKTACAACHTDVHKGQLGKDCIRCHPTKATFKDARRQFDHTTARFELTGAHVEVACAKCHKANVFRGLAFDTCTACHDEPHRKKLGPSCTSCHTTQTWDTRTVDHSKTAFPLAGAHAQVACVKCHPSGTMTKAVRADQCSACHVNVHKDSLKEDCRACHNETKFQGAQFDHATRTKFPLLGKHEGPACRACHTSVSEATTPLARKTADYGGLSRECVACHGEKDPHKGEFGRSCDSCHGPATFSVKDFTHPREPEFYGGQHEKVACEKCHVPGKTLLPFRTGSSNALVSSNAPASSKAPVSSKAPEPSMECAACHADVHLGQVGVTCETCHTVAGARFAAATFVHDKTQFPLTGKHQTTECAKCHPTETRAFPTGTGKAVVLKPVDVRCQACHKDPHMGQLDQKCETCHQTTTFVLTTFTHRGMDDFFSGVHAKYGCADCHKREEAQFPAGRGTAMRYIVGRTCASCHKTF